MLLSAAREIKQEGTERGLATFFVAKVRADDSRFRWAADRAKAK